MKHFLFLQSEVQTLSPSLSVFLLDFQAIQSINGEDELKGGETKTNVATTERPAEALDKGRGWGLADNVDYSSYACDARTTDNGVYTDPNYGYTVRICQINLNSGVGNSTVASVISTNAMNMFEAAAGAGVSLGISDGMRKVGDDSYSSYTEHKYGVAMDLGSPAGGSTICFSGVPSTRTGWGSKAQAEAACSNIGGGQYAAYQWLNANAANYGFFNLESEPWHWSTSGS